MIHAIRPRRSIVQALVLFLFLGGLLAITSVQSFAALTPATLAPQSNEYIFIENQIDNEFFVTPRNLDPRLSGANVWTKFGSTKQSSLGYLGVKNWTASSQYVDMWIESSALHTPFKGLRCVRGGQCPAQGFIQASMVDQNGFYKASARSGVNNGGYGYGLLSDSAFEYMRKLVVGMRNNFDLNFCRTKDEYNPQRGERCHSHAKKGNWYQTKFNITKTGHITLTDTRGASEVWINSNGMPSLGENSEFCHIGIVAGESGVICKMVKYEVRKTLDIYSTLRFNLIVDQAQLNFTPNSTSIKISGNNNQWYNYAANTPANAIFQSGTGYISAFFSNRFLKTLAASKGNIQGHEDIFTFNIRNTNTPESGYYQFSSSTRIQVSPREHSISIKPEAKSVGVLNGKIGSKQPIEFNYLVTLSAPRMADNVSAQAFGLSLKKDQLNYCGFKSIDQKYTVLIPAYLSYSIAGNQLRRIRNSCSDPEISIRDAIWTEVPWDQARSGSFYSTSLKLLFPMDDARSLLTEKGQHWEGTVYAEGVVRVKALWLSGQ